MAYEIYEATLKGNPGANSYKESAEVLKNQGIFAGLLCSDCHPINNLFAAEFAKGERRS